MMLTKKDSFLIFILFVLLSSYGLDISLVALAHDHNPVIDYEDNCPACQWEIQTKENDVFLQSLLNALQNPLLINLETLTYQTLIYNTFIYITSQLPRSPPTSDYEMGF
ncbi:MAG: hypothetical protein R6V04_11680 [bacterium]